MLIRRYRFKDLHGDDENSFRRINEFLLLGSKEYFCGYASFSNSARCSQRSAGLEKVLSSWILKIVALILVIKFFP